MNAILSHTSKLSSNPAQKLIADYYVLQEKFNAYLDQKNVVPENRRHLFDPINTALSRLVTHYSALPESLNPTITIGAIGDDIASLNRFMTELGKNPIFKSHQGQELVKDAHNLVAEIDKLFGAAPSRAK